MEDDEKAIGVSIFFYPITCSNLLSYLCNEYRFIYILFKRISIER